MSGNPTSPAMVSYYANHEHSKARARANAKRRYDRMKNDPEFMAKHRSKCRAWKIKNNPQFPRDPLFRAVSGTRKRILRRLRRRLRDYIGRNGNTLVPLIGCTSARLSAHLELLWQHGMSWQNYGAWHVDHIRPCVLYDVTIAEQQHKCFHWSNLQPLWAGDNIAKGIAYAA